MITNYKNEKPETFCFDIDGTLAKYINRSPFDETKVLDDKLIEPVGKVLLSLQQNYTIIFLSGRTDGCKDKTLEWIATKLGIHNATLFMRKTGDNRNDAIVKKEIYERDVLPNYNVIAVFDDRLRVLRMWFELGIFTFNVNQQNKEY